MTTCLCLYVFLIILASFINRNFASIVASNFNFFTAQSNTYSLVGSTIRARNTSPNAPEPIFLYSMTSSWAIIHIDDSGVSRTKMPQCSRKSKTKKVSPIAPTSTKVKIIAAAERKYSVWCGGSIFSSLTSFDSQWITREEYEEVDDSRTKLELFTCIAWTTSVDITVNFNGERSSHRMEHGIPCKMPETNISIVITGFPTPSTSMHAVTFIKK
ncbi:hypothetical protein GCK72_000476 [Caenorhabditis remanei]|uniref:Uncharacterized protein n=1 Tax=Caenorhabditis remanei TaxID=31234 RepID=A0A6A5HQY3_CAERE|nr:hypothetical protein GCK72_000476 [Caenorhabditis remanei]KAF1768663.1 hypothetical protein GCK72_000476 [Caenorhabditis remanei]